MGAGVLRVFLRGGPSLSEESADRGDLALTPGISPRASLRLSVEFHLFLMALSVLHTAGEGRAHTTVGRCLLYACMEPACAQLMRLEQ